MALLVRFVIPSAIFISSHKHLISVDKFYMLLQVVQAMVTLPFRCYESRYRCRSFWQYVPTT